MISTRAGDVRSATSSSCLISWPVHQCLCTEVEQADKATGLSMPFAGYALPKGLESAKFNDLTKVLNIATLNAGTASRS